MSGHPRRSPYYGWVLMVVLGITTIISYGTTQYLFGVLVVPLDATFHWGRASISGVYALGLIIAELLGVPIGYLVDRRGARLLMSCGSALAGLALIGLARMDGVFQFYLLWSGGWGWRWLSRSTRSPSLWWRTGLCAKEAPRSPS